MPQLIPLPKIRRFVAQDLKISRWEDVQPYFEQLLAQEVNTLPALQNWLQQRSELESVLDEDLAWRYIRMTCDTANEAHRQAYELFIGEIFPQMAPYDDQLNRQLLGSTVLDQITEPAFLLYKRRVEGAIRLYRAENIPLQA